MSMEYKKEVPYETTLLMAPLHLRYQVFHSRFFYSLQFIANLIQSFHSCILHTRHDMTVRIKCDSGRSMSGSLGDDL